MGNPFTTTSVSSYNSNPPPDDGTTVANNIIAWATIKTKLVDPIKSAFDTSETNTNSAFAKVVGGGGITSVSTNYTVLAADQGKTIVVTGSGGITITSPDATIVQSPFSFFLVNTATSSITYAGNNPGVQQTIDGANSITIPPGAGIYQNTNGTNWFSGGQQGLLVGKQLQYGDIINGTIVESNASNAVTFSLKTLAGNDPSSTDPVLICFRNATTTTGNYVYRTVTAATSLTISSGSTLGASNGVAFKVHLVLFDDAGTIRIGAINLESATSIYALSQTPMIASSTADGGGGFADSAQVFYTASGITLTSKAYLPWAIASYDSGLTTAGLWNVDPKLQLIGHGQMIPRALNAKEIPYGPKAWATFTVSAGTVTLQKSYNATVSRAATGHFALNFTNSMTDQYYAAAGTVAKSADESAFVITDAVTLPSTTAYTFYTKDIAGTLIDPTICSVVIFGN